MFIRLAANARRWGSGRGKVALRRIALGGAAACLAAVTPLSGIQAGPLNPFPYNMDSTLVIPYVSDGGIDRNGETVNGTVALQAGYYNRQGYAEPTPDIRYAFTVNGEAVSPILQSGQTFQWDTTSYNDGGHALGVIIVDGTENLGKYRAYASGVYVDNQPGAPSGPVSTPSFGNAIGSQLFGATPDAVTIDPSTDLPGAAPAPMTHVQTAPVHAQPDRFTDPMDAHANHNWFIEALTQSNTGLYQGDPGLYLTKDGNPIIRNYYPQVADDALESLDRVLRQNTKPGERNDNVVSPYATYAPDPDGPGYIGVDLAGWVYRVDETGKVTTIAGREVREEVIPLDYRDTSIDQQTLADHQVRWVGDFGHAPGHGHHGPSGADAVVPCAPDHIHEVPPMCNPHDIAVDPRDSKILYVADTDNHIITKIDMNLDPPKLSIYAGTKQTEGDDTTAGDVKFNRPTSITMTDDGTMYVADHGNNAIKVIAPDGTVSTVKTGLEGPFVVRLDSDGNIVFGENPTSRVKRLDLTSGAVTELADGHDSKWMWLDVDRKGNIGPVDDILYTTSTGGANNAHMFRVSKDGSRNDEFLPNTGTSGALNQGPANRSRDAHGHYPWVLTIDDDEGKILTHGFGNVGLRVVRLRNDQDPVASTYDHAAYGRGRNVFFSGSAFGFPFDARPSFTALRGESGHNLIGLPTFDELALMNDQSLTDYIRSGFGGSVPRPEITCADMDALIYYIRMNSLVAQSQPVAPGNSCANDPVAPEVSEISYGWTENGFEISWNTDEETIGYIAHGVSEDLHRWSDIESAFSTEHTIYLDTLPEDGTEIFFTIFARDRNGNIVVTDSDSTVLDRTEFTQAVGAPEGILLHALAILALMVARRRRTGLV